MTTHCQRCRQKCTDNAIEYTYKKPSLIKTKGNEKVFNGKLRREKVDENQWNRVSGRLERGKLFTSSARTVRSKKKVDKHQKISSTKINDKAGMPEAVS